METGTLRELNVKPGDVVEFVTGSAGFEDYTKKYGGTYSVVDADGDTKQHSDGSQGWCNESSHKFRIISRASDTPKTWGEMTDAEKGALLLAAHEGKVIESKYAHESQWYSYELRWDEDRPEPVRETVTLYGCEFKEDGWLFSPDKMPDGDTHRITFTLTDGTPDCTKCPTCGTAKHVDMEAL